MTFELIVWLIAIVIVLAILLFVTNVRRKQRFFSDTNIPGPSPTFLLGNLRTLWSASNYYRQLEEWTQQYGKVYGMYEGTLPILVTSDVNLLEEVFIKQFSIFDRRKPLMFLLPGQEKRISLFDANGAKWRRQRHVLNPGYSKAKVMQMLPLINECTTELVHALTPYANKNLDFDVMPLYFQMSMDAMLRCSFSFDTDVQRNPNNLYLQRVRTFFSADNKKQFVMKMASALPALTAFILGMFMRVYLFLHKLHDIFPSINFPEWPLLWLQDRIGEHVLRVREEKKDVGRVDLLHLLIEAATDENIIDEEVHTDENKRSDSVKKIMHEEILGNVSIFLIGATEMVSVVLSFCTYICATHPDVQRKLQDEIDANIPSDIKVPTYDMIDKLEYLDLFLKEVNRMYPIAPLILNRLCMQDTTIGQYTIKKGMIVQADNYTIHYSSELWGPVDPYTFCPERHKTKRHPIAYIAFGAGPRNCIGMRFALLELKMACVYLLRAFTIVKSDKLERNFEIIDCNTVKPSAVWIKLESRKKSN